MKFYLDSAEAAQWTLPAGCPPVQGVTTNPTLVMQAGLPVSLQGYLRLVSQAGEHRFAELMLQLPRADVVEAAQWLETLLPAALQARVRLTIKLPCHPDWQSVLREVQAWGVSTLLTGLSNPMQLLWARAQGASYVAPYVGRLQSDGRDVWSLLRACVAVQGDGPRLLAASIKSADVLAQLIASGAHAVTVRPEFAASLVTDPLTLSAMAQFDDDIAQSQGFTLD
jgi:transaldolase